MRTSSRSGCVICSRRYRWLALVLAALSAGSFAAELREIEVTHEKGVYRLNSVTWLDAPIAGVFDVLTDYDQFERVSSVYDEARYLEREDDAAPRVFTRVKGCVLFFCQTIDRTETLTNHGLNCLRAVTDPAVSDFDQAEARWVLRELDEGTEVTYSIVMEPSFFIPPLVGPYVLKRRLKKGAGGAIDRMERFARASEATDEAFAERGLSVDEAEDDCDTWFAAPEA